MTQAKYVYVLCFKNMTPFQTNIMIVLNWVVPGLLIIPQAFFEFGYHTFNESQALLLYWENQSQQVCVEENTVSNLSKVTTYQIKIHAMLLN